MNSSTCLIALAVSLSVHATLEAQQDQEQPAITFADDIQPVLAKRCYQCHGADHVESGLRLDRRRNAMAGGDLGIAISPGNPSASGIIQRISSSEADRMPPEGARLTSSEIKSLERWIQQGARWPDGLDGKPDPIDTHWSWQPFNASVPPDVNEQSWPQNEIDFFVLRKLEDRSLTPSPVAARHLLIRRAFLDVIGLPPTPEEWQHWMQLTSDDWYPQLIEHLLESPHYGERWGRIWLDQARYADSDGYEKDQPRPNAYLYRDWVIDALNSDLAFDEFSIQQLAGDLLPDTTPKIISATGFHRNTLTNREGGIDREEDRVKQTIDRLNTTFTVWMGLTVQCAQCHSHKYDPISQREYYQLYSFFNDADETDVLLEPSESQTLAFTKAQEAHQQMMDASRVKLASVRERIAAQQPTLAEELKRRFPSGKPTAPRSGLVAHFAFDGDGQTALSNLTAPHDSHSTARLAGPGSFSRTDRPLPEASMTQAISLPGDGQHLELKGVSEFRSDQPFTCAVWIKPANNLGSILTKIDEPNDFRGIDFTNNKGLLEIHLVDKWPDNAIKVTPVSARLNKEKWQHVAFSYDGSKKASGIAMYINGESVDLKVHFDSLSGDFVTADPWRVGRRKVGAFFKGSLDDLRIYERVLRPGEVALLQGESPQLANALRIAASPAEERSDKDSQSLLDYFVAADAEAAPLQTELNNLQNNPPTIARSSAMALKRHDKPRVTHVHRRGDFLDKGVQVEIGTPAFLPPLVPRGDRPDRLDLARWMFHPGNTLTPRVFVNRVWQTYFGRGLVATDNDFGTQGDDPSHPQLLDWMARDLVTHDWKLKHLHRKILLSATYQQDSKYRPALHERDPDNTLLGRQRRLRVSAESVRDLALSASGLLDRRIKGPSVFPPLPAGVIELAFVDVINRGPWKESTGEDRYRRGIYTFFQRTSPYPMLVLFDAPDSNVACTRRENSNTPLQALTLWNDAVFTDCARHLALNLIESSEGEDDRIERAFACCLSRIPSRAEMRVLQKLLQQSRTAYEKKPELARTARGHVTIPKGTSDIEFAAWMSLSRALINLDEFITRQ